MTRGLVIPAAMPVSAENSAVKIGGQIPSELVRKWLLFWDEFACPDNNFISLGLSADLAYLQQLGVLRRNKVNFSGSVSGGDFVHVFLAAQEVTFRELSLKDPGKWALGSTENILTANQGPMARQCLTFELVNCIQIPSKEIPLEDILIFKQKRRPELDAFHSYLSEIYLKVISSGDVPRAKTLEIEKFEIALKEINRVSSESFPTRCLTGFRIVLDRSMIETISMGIAAASIAPSMGLPMLNTGVFAASATFALRNILSSDPREKQPLAYLSDAIRRL